MVKSKQCQEEIRRNNNRIGIFFNMKNKMNNSMPINFKTWAKLIKFIGKYELPKLT